MIDKVDTPNVAKSIEEAKARLKNIDKGQVKDNNTKAKNKRTY